MINPDGIKMRLSIDRVLNELKSMYQADLDGTGGAVTSLTNSDVERWSAELGAPRALLYDRLAHHLASGFYRNDLPYTFCDTIMSDLHAVMSVENEDRPELFWSVYLAFDEGEYACPGDGTVDPIAKYTRPLIAEIITEYGHGFAESQTSSPI